MQLPVKEVDGSRFRLGTSQTPQQDSKSQLKLPGLDFTGPAIETSINSEPCIARPFSTKCTRPSLTQSRRPRRRSTGNEGCGLGFRV